MVAYAAMMRRTLGPLILRGLAKIGASEPIFDWGSFSMSVQNSLRQPFGLTPPSKRGRQGGYAANRVNNNLSHQSKKSFSVSKNFFRLGVDLLSMVSSSFCSSSRCSLVSRVGVSTTTVKR